MYEHIRVEGEGAVGELILNRPEARNAMTAAMGDEIRAAVGELNARDDLRVVLVRAEGKVFAAGGDFKYLEARLTAEPEANRHTMLGFYRRYLSIRDLRVPSIAVLHGHAIGAGLCFPLGCDIRLAARGAKMGLNFVRIGIHPGMGGSYLLPKIVGQAKAAELMLTGRLIDADEAARIGLVSSVYEPDEILPAARAIAEEIATAAPVAVQQLKTSLRYAGERTLDEALEAEAAAQAIDYATADMAEGVRAFYEKRKPVFEGK